MSINLDAEYRKYMGECIDLGLQVPYGIRRPYVGSLVINKGVVLGRGYRSFVDSTSLLIHAERMALNEAGDLAKGALLFTTLEPCVRVKGRNQIFSSCSELIVESGIDTVIFALIDRTVSCHKESGEEYLRRNGVYVKRYTDLNDLIIKELMPGSCLRF